MLPSDPCVLAMSGSVSCIKFALYRVGDGLTPRLHGQIDRVGMSGTNVTTNDSAVTKLESFSNAGADYPSATQFLLDMLEARNVRESIRAVGHRVIHGMKHHQSEFVTQELLDELRRISPFAPEHLPSEIHLIEAFRQRHPNMAQIACFDTAFHRHMPRVAKMLPIPRRFDSKGVQRYGFHGLSYCYAMEELARLGDPAVTKGRIILAHLGKSASLAAVLDGMSIDTSMGSTPSAGLMMSTRSGDLDPGILPYLAQTEQMTAEHFYEIVNHQSGLLGVSEISSDMRDLLAQEASETWAAEAVALFCYQAKKWIGAFAAVLNGLDTLVFTGGIGANSPVIRQRICEGLGFLGVKLSTNANLQNSQVVSSEDSRVNVRAIPSDEELMIARLVTRKLQEP